jgi:hypothetical protein
MNIHEMLWAGGAIQGNLDTTFLNFVASAVPKGRTFKPLRRVKRNPVITFEPICGFG